MQASSPLRLLTRIAFRITAGIFLCSFAFPAIAQQGVPLPPGAASSQYPPPAAGRTVTLDVVAADRSGKLVSGLGQPDFTVLDNKQPQKLLSFRAIDQTSSAPPPEVILVVDAVNANFITVSYERNQIVKFLGQNGGKLAQPVSLVFFADTKTSMQNTPTTDGNSLIAAFDKNVSGLRSITRSEGYWGAVDRLDISLRALGLLANYEAARPGRKLVIWVSPGWAYLSGPRMELTNTEQRHLFNSIVGMSTVLRAARITLYNVDPLGTADAGGFRTFYYQSFLKGVKSPNQVQVGNLALQVLATQSGGMVLNSSNDIAAEITRCTADASSYYELSFDPPPADGPDDYRSIEVKIGKPGLTARTRTGYYAQP